MQESQSERRARLQSAKASRQNAFRSAFAEEIIGWLGATALLLAFGLGAARVLPASSPFYLTLNLLGAAGIAYVSLARRAYPPAVLNIVWAVVAALSLVILLSHI